MGDSEIQHFSFEASSFLNPQVLNHEHLVRAQHRITILKGAITVIAGFTDELRLTFAHELATILQSDLVIGARLAASQQAAHENEEKNKGLGHTKQQTGQERKTFAAFRKSA